MGDTAPQWVVQSHSLIMAYHSKAKLCPLANPIMHTTIQMGIDAFMDDTNHLLGDDTTDTLCTILPDAQSNLNLC